MYLFFYLECHISMTAIFLCTPLRGLWTWRSGFEWWKKCDLHSCRQWVVHSKFRNIVFFFIWTWHRMCQDLSLVIHVIGQDIFSVPVQGINQYLKIGRVLLFVLSLVRCFKRELLNDKGNTKTCLLFRACGWGSVRWMGPGFEMTTFQTHYF